MVGSPTTLQAARVRVVMLTGDGRTTAEAVARQLGIDEVQAEVDQQPIVARTVFTSTWVRSDWLMIWLRCRARCEVSDSTLL